MNQGEKIQTEYDDIDLMDYIKVLVKRKWLILIVFLAAIIIAAAFSFLLPKVYKIDTSLEIGRIDGQMMEDPGQVVEKINSDTYGILIREKLEILEEKYPKIEVENPEDTRLINIKIESSNAQQAKNILEEINSLILKKHQEKLDKKKRKIEENIEEIQEELTLLETKKQYSEGIAELQIEILTLKDQINSCTLTEVVKTPTISKEPVKPRPILNIVIAGVLGIFLGIFLAFGKEWWEKNKLKI